MKILCITAALGTVLLFLCSCQGMAEAMKKGFNDMNQSMNPTGRKAPNKTVAEKEEDEQVGIYGELNATERKYLRRIHRQNAKDAAANENLVFGHWKPSTLQKK